MPRRFIAESCRSSPTLVKLTAESERLLWRLLTVADDFGRFEACGEVVKAACFQRNGDTIKTADVRKCVQMLADVNILKLYEKDERQYGQFVAWEKFQGKPRAQHSKYPDPVDCVQMRADATQARADVLVSVSEKSSSSSSSYRDNPKKDSLSPLKVEGKVVVVTKFDEFWTLYPKCVHKVGKGLTRKAWEKIQPDDIFAQAIIDSLQKHLTCEQWTKDDGQFIPMPATWLNQGRWEDDPKTKNIKSRKYFTMPTEGQL